MDQLFISNQFRLFYTLQGKHALADIKDINANKIPDIVENTAIQLNVANQLFNEVFHFVQPQQNERYKNKLQFIDVHFLLSKVNGSSGDGLINYHYQNQNAGNAFSLSIAISTKIKTGNLTPAHELFHAYQNGYTFFKNRWYTEGTARWVEFAFKSGTGEQKPLPNTQHALEELLSKTYDAKFFWNRIAFLCAKTPNLFTIPTDLSSIQYIGNHEPLIKGHEIYGYDFILSLLKNLQQLDDLSAQDRGLDRNHWKETEQKSDKNNLYILMALEQTIENNDCGKKTEVAIFVELINDFINRPTVFKAKTSANEIQYLGNPYQHYYKDGEHIYSRNIWDMQFFNQKLFIGAGNASNSSPSPNSGPVPIISYDPGKHVFTTEGMVDDEQIDRYKIINEQLFIPGFDAKENHKWGNFYRRDVNGRWIKKRTIAKGLHVFDLLKFENKLFAGILSSKGATVAISKDDGETWSSHYLGDRQRVYDLFKVKNKLYAVKQFLSSSSVNKLPDEDQRKHHFSVAEWYQGKFIPRQDLNRSVFFPEMNLNEKRTIRISRTIQLEDRVIYLAAYNYNVPFGFFIASSLDSNSIDIKHIKLPSKVKPRDMLHRNGVIYLLASEKNNKKFQVKVYKILINSPEKLDQVISFPSSVFARSFEELDGNFYFGMGSDVRNKKIWKQEELKPETGNIVKVQSGYIRE